MQSWSTWIIKWWCIDTETCLKNKILKKICCFLFLFCSFCGGFVKQKLYTWIREVLEWYFFISYYKRSFRCTSTISWNKCIEYLKKDIVSFIVPFCLDKSQFRYIFNISRTFFWIPPRIFMNLFFFFSLLSFFFFYNEVHLSW